MEKGVGRRALGEGVRGGGGGEREGKKRCGRRASVPGRFWIWTR